jgi:hypothetical protein
MSKSNPDKSVADYASVSLTTQAGQGSELTNIVIQAHVDVTQTPKQIDDDLDKLGDALARQRVIAEIPSYRRQIERDNAHIRQMEEDIKRLDQEEKSKWVEAGRPESEFRFKKSTETHRKEALFNIKNIKERIQEHENKLQYALDVKHGKAKADKAA